MIDKKKITNFRTRINRAKNTMSVCGDMMMRMDFDYMSLEDLKALQAGLLNSRKPLSYKYLDEIIIEKSA